MKSTLWFWLSALLVVNSTTLVSEETDEIALKTQETRQQQELEKGKIFQGSGTPEERKYYERQAPKNVEKNRRFYEESHPLESVPIRKEPLQEAPIPSKPLEG